MPSAEIIAIGTELLLGEIQDTNTRYLARILRDAGIDIFRATIVGDNTERIAQAIQEALGRTNIIITTGGLGPTVDDPTRQAVALAIGVETEFRPELWNQILARFKRYNRQTTENNRRQAYIPKGAIPVENPVGTAPAFIYETGEHSIISLPGVPREMEYLIEHVVMPYLRQRYTLKGTIKAKVLHVSGLGESQVDEWIGDLETYRNPTVGLLAHPGQVDIRVTAKADSIEEADRLIDELAKIVRQRLGDAIFGNDFDTLEEVTVKKLSALGWKLLVVECGLGGELRGALKRAHFPEEQVVVLPQVSDENNLFENISKINDEFQANAILTVNYQPGVEKQLVKIDVVSPFGKKKGSFYYGGPPASGIPWAVNMSLDYLRRNMP
jgi:competence/damage-inducible protein CinA-like protein